MSALQGPEANPYAAVAFALSLAHPDGPRLFLTDWVRGDVTDWPEFEGFAIWAATDGEAERRRLGAQA